MKRNRGQRVDRDIQKITVEIFCAELSFVSDYLYFEVLYENDYPELAELFECFGREHAKNMRAFKTVDARNIHTNSNLTKASFSVCDVIRALLGKERELKLLYERLYLLCESEELDARIKEILRASELRLSILENIQKT